MAELVLGIANAPRAHLAFPEAAMEGIARIGVGVGDRLRGRSRDQTLAGHGCRRAARGVVRNADDAGHDRAPGREAFIMAPVANRRPSIIKEPI